MQLSPLSINMQSIVDQSIVHLSRGGNARPETGLFQCRGVPRDLAMTISIYYYSNDASE